MGKFVSYLFGIDYKVFPFFRDRHWEFVKFFPDKIRVSLFDKKLVFIFNKKIS